MRRIALGVALAALTAGAARSSPTQEAWSGAGVGIFSWSPRGRGDAALGEALPADRFDLHDQSSLDHHGEGGGVRAAWLPGRVGLHAAFVRARHDDEGTTTRAISVEDRTFPAGTRLRTGFRFDAGYAALSLAHGWGMIPDPSPDAAIRYEVRTLAGVSSVRWESDWEGAGISVSETLRMTGPAVGFAARMRERWAYASALVLGAAYLGSPEGTGVHGDARVGVRWRRWAAEAGWHQVWLDVSDEEDSLDVAYGGPVFGLRASF